MGRTNGIAAAYAGIRQRPVYGWGFERSGRFARLAIHAAFWAALLATVAGTARAQAPDEQLQRDWLEVQTGKSQQVKKDWWQRLEPARLAAFIEAGVEVNVSDRRGWTPLHSAARYNADETIVLTLVRSGATVDARDRAGDTPLHWAAAENSNVEIVTALLAAGADVNASDRFGWLPIHTAAETNANPDVIEALLGAGAKPNRRAYFLFFRPVFLLKHNKNLSDADRKAAMALLQNPG